MRNENLKDELNNLPQDFDREQIWTSIELPKKKQSKRRIFWMFLSGLALLLFFLLTVALFENEPSEKIKSAKNQQLEGQLSEEIIADRIEGSEETWSKENDLEKSGSSDIKTEESELENSTSISDITNDMEESNSVVENDIEMYSFLDNQDSKNQKSNFIRSETQKSNINFYNIKKSDNQLINKKWPSEEGALFEERIDKEEGDKLNLSIDHIPFISLPLIIAHRDETRLEPLALDIVKKDRHIASDYGLSFYALMGTSIHDFGTSEYTLKRQTDEKPLESISMGILGHRSFGKMVLFSGISYSIHNTFLTHKNQEYAILNNIDGQVKRLITTDYSLHNSYQYVDLVLGMGYNFQLSEKWSLTPSIQLGYSLDFNAEGYLFDQSDRAEDLSEISEYANFGKWQGRSNLKISRNIGSHWEVGILAYVSTRKTLAGFDEGPHSIYSHGFGFSIGRFFK